MFFTRGNSGLSAAQKKVKVGISWGLIIADCILLALRASQKSFIQATQALLDGSIGKLSNLASYIPFVGKGLKSLGDLMETIVMFIPKAMGQAYEYACVVFIATTLIRLVPYIIATFVVEREIAQKKVANSQSVTVHTDVKITDVDATKTSMQQIEKARVHDSACNTVASIEKNDDLRPMNLEQGVLINDKLR
mgnify:CR=1 FL=1